MADFKIKKCPECGYSIIAYAAEGVWYIEVHTKPGTVEQRKGTTCPGSRKEVK